MASREEIREGLEDIVRKSNPSCGLRKECWTKCAECGADRILTYLDSQGVVLKVEGELPEDCQYCSRHPFKAGYSLTERLIEVKETA